MASLRSTGYVDAGWEHGVAQDERKKKVQCNYCGKLVSGGIYRLKQHLARVSGEVTYCDKAPEDVCLKMRENLEGCRLSKKPRLVEYDEQAYFSFHASDDAEEEDQLGYRSKGKQLMNDKGLVINMTPLRTLGYVDPGWEHGIPQDERKKKVKCNYCEKIVSGGINRFKQHLARIPGEVAPCKSAPEVVYLRIKENMKWHRTGRRHRRPHTKELSSSFMNSDNEEEDEDQKEEAPHHHMSNEKLLIGDKRLDRESRRTFKGMSPDIGSESFLKRTKYDTWGTKTPRSLLQASGKQVKVFSNKKSRKEVISSICKFFYHAGVPPHAAMSPYFQKMLELVGQYGEGLAGPSSRVLSGHFLQDEIVSIRNHLSEYKASWVVTGCSILADSWHDTHSRTLINIFVSCPRSMYFVCSIDATDVVEDATYIFKLLDKVVEDMGEENVVQVITQNTSNYQAAGKMLEEKRRNLFWTPCAAYCIDHILEDFVKIKWVRECMEKGQKITKFIYNRFWLLSLMKKEFTTGQELLKPSFTQFSSTFATVQSLLDHRNSLKRMFQSNKWLSSGYSKLKDGKEVEKLVLNATFWSKMQYVRKSVDPILEVLQKINSNESRSIPFIYNNVYQAKLVIRTNHNDDECKYQNFLDIIDSNWNSLSHHPLYLAAHFLNPSYRYHPDFVPHPELVRGLNACIVRLEPDNARRISASMQISDFSSAKGDFGTDLAISTRMVLNPAAWWQQHGINCLELQHLAVRILSQTCSSFGCEHNWSVYDQIHSQRHNRVAQKRLNDVTYVHYNLRVRDRQLRKMSSDPIFLDSVLHESLLYDWIVESGKPALQEDEDILYSEMELGEYENDFTEHDGGNADSRKGSLEMVTSAGEAEPLEVNADNTGTATDDDSDLNLLDNEFSD